MIPTKPTQKPRSGDEVMCLNGHAAQASLLMESEMTKAHVIYKITNFIDKIKGIDHKIAILRRQKLDCHECTLDHTLPFVRFVCGRHCPSPAWREPLHWGESIPTIAWRTFAPLDLDVLSAEDAVTATMKDAPWRFGIEHDVAWSMQSHGTWTEENGMRVWRMGVQAEGATGWSFYLSTFDLPKAAELFVYNGSRTQFLGAYTHENNKPWGGLAIGVLKENKWFWNTESPWASQFQDKLRLDKWFRGTVRCCCEKPNCKPNSLRMVPLETAAPATST